MPIFFYPGTFTECLLRTGRSEECKKPKPYLYMKKILIALE